MAGPGRARAACPPACVPPIRDGSFVGTDGHALVVDGQPFHAVGANAAVMHGAVHRAEAFATLEQVARDGASVVRLWALGEAAEDAPTYWDQQAFRRGPEGWLERAGEHLDQVLAEARRLGLRVILVLANRWSDYGGVAQYLRWIGEPPAGPVPTALELATFYRSPASEALYRAHVERLLSRTSTVTGRPYRSDPTILGWELINEAEAFGADGSAALLDWVGRQAAFIHRRDPNHLVSAGHIGYRTPAERRLWRAVCAAPGVDYCDSHAYPLRHGDVRHPARLARWIDDRVQLAQHVGGKPLLFGEVGVRTDRLVLYGRRRGGWLDAFLRRTIFDGAAGALVWVYLPSPGPRRRFGVYTAGPRRRQTLDVRQVVAAWAERARRLEPRDRNPRLGDARGDAPLVPLGERRRGPATVHRPGPDGRVLIDARAFVVAAFDRVGEWREGGGPAHVYGVGAGRVTYRFRLPAGLEADLELGLRVSSELPGTGAGARPADTSTVVVRLDGEERGRFVAPVDDGAGAWITLPLGGVAEPAAGGVHRLTLEAVGDGAGGVCLYLDGPEGEPAGIEVRVEARRAAL
ncbi:MAG: hypothetical protein ACFCGT_22625 [Sandaracinaceae bacterium]